VREGIHPEYIESTISCACGNVVTTRATVPSMHVDICSKCHPFFTGKKQLLTDRGGRIEQFNKRYGVDAGSAPSAEAPAEGAADAAAAPDAAETVEVEATAPA